VFATANVRDVLTDLFGASGPESDMPKTSTAVHIAVEAEQTRAK